MRITGGQLRGRQIKVPNTGDVRPATSILRQSFFNQIQSAIAGAKVLDLFSGSGMLAFESLSRGAADVTSVELAPAHVRIILENQKKLGINPDHHRVVQGDVLAFLSKPPKGAMATEQLPYDIVFMDPPFRLDAMDKLLKGLIDGPWVREGSIIAFHRGDTLWENHWEGFDLRKFGDSYLAVGYLGEIHPLSSAPN